MILMLVQALLALALTLDSFGRLVKVNTRTAAPVRHAFAALFTSSLCLASTTISGVTEASWPIVLMLVGVIAVQLATARYWRRGPPAVFQEQS